MNSNVKKWGLAAAGAVAIGALAIATPAIAGAAGSVSGSVEAATSTPTGPNADQGGRGKGGAARPR